jgi:CheY-like chemotaxis protein
MHATIRDVITLLSRTIDKRIVFQENFNTPRSRIVGDPSQLHQVILNLALNARDAMPDGGVITCSTRVASAEASDRRFTGISAHEYLVVSIADTGCGIAKDILGRIFEPFFTTKGPGKGTGMGLAMVYGIVHNHGGYLEVESEVGCGTTFHLYLPLANGHATPVAAPPASVPEPGRGRILVVDDEPLVRDVAGNMLVHLGYQILKAGDGEEAVEYYRAYQHEIVLVMIDMIMPRMNGRDCFRKLKQINPDVKAVLCTGYDRNLGVQEILDEGMHGFVQKPYDLAQLSNVVSQALQGSGRHKK